MTLPRRPSRLVHFFRLSPRRLVVLVLLLAVLAAAGWGLARRLWGPVAWTEDWIAPPGFTEAISDLSSGRADEGEQRLDDVFADVRSTVWRRRGHLALGTARLRRREFDRAHRAFGAAESGGGPLAAFASLERAEALLGAGKSREAAELIARAAASAKGPALADDLAIASTRARAATGDLPGGLRAIESHLASGACLDPARVLEDAARLADERSAQPEALRLWKRLYFDHPRTAEASRAASRLASATPIPTRFSAADLDRVAVRARTLAASGDGRAALASWDLVLSAIPSSTLGPASRLDLAEAAIEGREHARALALAGKPPSPRAEPRRALLYGRALFGLGRDSEAKAVLRLAADGSGEGAAESRFLYATALDQEDRDREALDQFLRYLRDHRDGGRMDGALWRAAWLSFRLGRKPQARRLFQDLIARPQAAAYHPSAVHWLARIEESMGEKSEAVLLYRRLERDFTRDYYGLLAARRLAAMGERSAQASGGPPKEASGAEPARDRAQKSLGAPSRAFCLAPRDTGAAAHVLAGCEFEIAGLYLDAERQYEAARARSEASSTAIPAGGGAAPGAGATVRSSAPGAPTGGRADRALLLRLSEFALHRGDRAEAIARLKAAVPGYLAAPIGTIPRRYWEVLYPRREWETIAEFARSRRLDPALVCGLVLQESAFNPLAVSGAGAMGLMQVLPGTGRQAAAADGAKSFTAARLLEPATNIRLGTWHFAALLDRYGGSLELALAAYNAGETRAARWRSRFGLSDPASFVENVPYTETRLYVKRILSHAAMYRAIYGP